MPDKPFVINDRRKFTMDGDIRPDAPQEEPKPAVQEPEAARGPQLVSEDSVAKHNEPIAFPSPAGSDSIAEESGEEPLPPPPTADQIAQAERAYTATAERLDTAMRAMDPGAKHPPAMDFTQFVQSLYMQTLIQLGGMTEPGQPVRVDIIGARNTIDMLAILTDKTSGNLSEAESNLIQSALFELRLGFLDVTQALAQQAAQRGTPGAGAMPPPPGGGPSLIR